ncbi:MFS transporter [Agrobacterium tumefaciens]|uniref:MFS transporter n=1 Tax=Agrobacterium tumefaciens TaxID=358 RepID=UPI001D889093|nr:MFS transporter [Agrobacterium tumefaciens]NTD92684.1 MFS transporter [Agrobacterium tumefaciens]NTD97107.1 MFS transporter [Agrobacterium tumefaciens]NTE15014.1 MFS transporter [Agrobacterium tumefaciens]NTE27101.1 MFS transporter [Agrobacterium tumefaciens]
MEQTKSFALEKEKTGITVTLALAMLLASLGTSIANIALPALVDAFAAPFLQVQAVVVAYLAAMTVSVVIAGRLGDSRGLKPMLVVGLAVFAIASLLCAIAPNLSLLIGARALQGVGAAFLMTLAMALMRQTANEARVGRAMGLLGTVSALSTALGPSLGGLLIPVAGWRGIFWMQVPLAVLALVLAIRLLPAGPAKAKALSVTLWSVMTRNLVTNLLVNIVVAAVMMTTLVVGPFYLGIALGLTATQVGFVMAVGPVISIFSGVPSGRMVDVWGSGRILAIGLALLAAGSFLLALLPNRIGVTGYVISIIVLTPGYQLFQAANNTAALAEVSKDRRGTVSGLISLSRNIGLIAGASAMGAVFAFGVGMEEFARATASAIASGMRLTFLLAGGMMLVAIGIAIRHSNPIPPP